MATMILLGVMELFYNWTGDGYTTVETVKWALIMKNCVIRNLYVNEADTWPGLGWGRPDKGNHW